MGKGLARAYLFTNGMVMAFDDEGMQFPEYQGHGREIIPKIRRDFPALIIEGMDWRTDVIPPGDDNAVRFNRGRDGSSSR